MRLTLVLALFLTACKKSTEPPFVPVPAAAPTVDLQAPVPFLDTIRTGTLPNGMTYFIRRNAKPENRAVFRLAVDAGSALEDEDQLGLAHFVEHMAFNGTEHYPGNELVKFLESTGTRFGAHLNAHTSFEETVYKLVVPADEPETMDAAFTIFRDWACCLTFADDEIEKERGVVLEEWRRRLGPGQRYWERFAPMLYRGAPHGDRLPIGTEASLKSFEPDASRRFFEEWYRPDLMAIIIVGAVDLDATEARVKDTFGTIPAPAEPRPRPTLRLDMQHERLYDLAEDPESSNSTLRIIAKKPLADQGNYGDYRQGLLQRVALGVLNERLSERAREPEAPYLNAGAGVGRFNPEQISESISIAFDGDNELPALEAVLLEVQRLRLHGVNPGEFRRAKEVVLDGYEASLKEEGTIESASRADELVRHFLNGESVPGIPAEAAMAKQFVPTFTKAEIDAWLQGFLKSDAELVSLVKVERDGGTLASEAEVAAVFDAVSKAQIDVLEEQAEITALVATPPRPGEIVQVDERYASIGFTGWTFANGIQVWFRKTDFKEDQVSMQGWIDGGHTAVSDEAWNDARAADAVVTWSGIGPHDAETVTRFLKGKRASLGVNIGEFETTFAGTASPDDLGIQLQRLYLTATDGGFTEKGLVQMKTRWGASVRDRLKSPAAHFGDAWTALGWTENPRLAPTTMEHVDAVTLEGAEAVWKQAMSGIGRARFVFVGNLPDDFEEQVSTWIGGLPAAAEGLKEVPPPYERKKGDLAKTLKKGIDQKATFKMEYWGERETLDRVERARMDATADILAVILRERLREELGGVYGVGVGFTAGNFPKPHFGFRIEFTCEPKRVDELEKTVLAALDEVATKGVDPSYVEAEINKNRQAHEERQLTNGFWLSLLRSSLDWGEDPRAILEYEELNAQLTPAMVQDIVKRSFERDHRATLKMLPEG